MIDLHSEKMLIGGGAKWVDWQSPNMTGYGTFGGNDYGIADSGTSSAFPGYYGWKAFHGTATSDQYIQNAPNWLTFYTPSEIKISYITIQAFLTAMDGVGVNNRIDVSNDNATWRTVYENMGNSGWSSLRKISLNLDEAYKYVRFYQKYSAHSWGTSLRGIKIYGLRKE